MAATIAAAMARLRLPRESLSTFKLRLPSFSPDISEVSEKDKHTAGRNFLDVTYVRNGDCLR